MSETTPPTDAGAASRPRGLDRDAARALPWWVTSDEQLDGLPIGPPYCIVAAPPGTDPWEWAIGTRGGRVVLHGGGRLHTLAGHRGTVCDVAWRPDGTEVASVDTSDQLIVWDVSGADVAPPVVRLEVPRRERSSPPVVVHNDLYRRRAVAWSDDGELIACGGTGTVVHVLDRSRDHEVIRKLSVPHPVTALAFSPGLRHLAVASDFRVTIWSVPSHGRRSGSADWPLVHEWSEESAFDEDVMASRGWSGVESLSWSPDGTRLVTGGGLTAVDWDVASGEGHHRVLPGPELVDAVAWSPRGGEVAVGGGDQVHVVRSGARVVTAVINVPGRQVQDLAWSPDGTRLATAGTDGATRLWDPSRPTKQTDALPGRTSWCLAARWAPDGSGRLAVANADGFVTVWHPLARPDGLRPVTFDAHERGVNDLAWSPDGRRLATASDDGTVRLWDPDEPVVPPTTLAAGGRLLSVAWTVDGGGLAAGGIDAVHVWGDPETSETPRVVAAGGFVTHLAWGPPRWAGARPEAPLLAIGAGTVHLWDPERPDDPLVRVPGRTSTKALAWSETGDLASVSDDLQGRPEIFVGLPTQPPEPLAITTSFRHPPRSIGWGQPATGTVMAVGCADGVVRMWDPADPNADLLSDPEAHHDWVTGMGWAPDGRAVATASHDGTCRVYRRADDGWRLVGVMVEWTFGGLLEASQPDRSRGLLSDRPADRDWLGAEDIAEELDIALRRQLTPGVDVSLAVHIDGPWGRGKTTLLEKIRSFEPKPEIPDRHPWILVHHDAWRHSRTSQSWSALANDLHQAVAAAREGWGRTRFATATAWRRASQAVGPAAVVLALIAFVVVVVMTVWLRGLSWEQLAGTTIGIATLVAALGVIWGLLVKAGSLAEGIGRRSRPRIAQALATATLTPLGETAEQVRWLRHQATRLPTGSARADGAPPILYAIDDLDRCSAEVVVEVLDSVHTLMRPDLHESPPKTGDLAPIVFLVLADGAWIRRAYQQVHGVEGDSTEADIGAKFLAKLFDYTLTLPPITASLQKSYTDGVATELGGPRRRAPVVPSSSSAAQPPGPDASEEDEPGDPGQAARRAHERNQGTATARADSETAGKESAPEVLAERSRHLLHDHAARLPRNPRGFKRVVNDWTMQRIAQRPLKDDEKIEDDDVVIRWVILRHRWPALAEQLLGLPGLEDPAAIDPAAIEDHLGDALVALARTPDVADVWPIWSDGQVDRTWLRHVGVLAGRCTNVAVSPGPTPSP